MYALWILYKEQYQYYRINTDRETVTMGAISRIR